jgi:uncharacterized protein
MAFRLRHRTALRMLSAVLILGAALPVGVGGVRPARAQFFDLFQRPPASSETPRQPMGVPPQRHGPGFGPGGQTDFGRPLFGPPRYDSRPDLDQPRSDRRLYEPSRPDERRRKPAPRYVEPRQEDFSKAPLPRKQQVEPRRKVIVLGDSMADWLAYGLEDTLSEHPEELGVVRMHRTPSSLIRNEAKDHDWVQAAHELLAKQAADFILVMIGLSDRNAIRDFPAPKTSQSTTQKPSEATLPTANPPEVPDESSADLPRPETERSGPSLTHQFGSEKWGELYGRRIDQLIAVLKRKNVPVFWVGLPPIKGARSQREMTYLNGLFKARAEKSGIIYVDVWDGFADDDRNYATYGPDVAGQVRQLRSGDGVHFTKAGAQKLAHFVEREIRRLMTRDTPVALPLPDDAQKPKGGAPKRPAQRPIAGPVIPLTGQQLGGEYETLLGARPDLEESLATRVLLKGEPLEGKKGRADDFGWPPAAADVIAPTDPVAASRPDAEPKQTSRSAARPARQTEGKGSSSQRR